MGICQNKNLVAMAGKKQQKKIKGPINIQCPICEESFNTDNKKPFQICKNRHVVCLHCLDSMKNHSRMKRKQFLQCPFCKQPCTEDLLKTNSGIFQFLEQEIDTLNKLSEDRKKLYVFSSIYLPSLHKIMKQDASKDNKKMQKDEKTLFQALQSLRIRGKMMQEYEVFDLEMFNCCSNLKKLYIIKNQIKALQTSSFTHDKLLLLQLSRNKIEGMKSIMGDNPAPFHFLRVLILQKNQIQKIEGISHLQYLQILNLCSNRIKKLEDLHGLSSLLDLNLQHNEITQLIQFPYLNQLRALRLCNICLKSVGNNIIPHMWTKFQSFKLSELRVLTLTVFGNIFDKYSCHNSLRKARWESLLLIIAEMLQDQAENMNEIDEKGLKVDQLTFIQISNSNKQLYEHETRGNFGFLKKAINTAINYDKNGEHINFKPNFRTQIYEVNQFTNVIKKIGQSKQVIDYLYHPINIQPEIVDSKFIKFYSNTNKITLGISKTTGNLHTLQINLQESTSQIAANIQPIIGLRDAIVIKSPFQCILKVCFGNKKVDLIINSQKLSEFENVDLSEMNFFINLIEVGGEVIVSKLNLS